jgi:hypothetical protein
MSDALTGDLFLTKSALKSTKFGDRTTKEFLEKVSQDSKAIQRENAASPKSTLPGE